MRAIGTVPRIREELPRGSHRTQRLCAAITRFFGLLPIAPKAMTTAAADRHCFRCCEPASFCIALWNRTVQNDPGFLSSCHKDRLLTFLNLVCHNPIMPKLRSIRAMEECVPAVSAQLCGGLIRRTLFRPVRGYISGSGLASPIPPRDDRFREGLDRRTHFSRFSSFFSVSFRCCRAYCNGGFFPFCFSNRAAYAYFCANYPYIKDIFQKTRFKY